jgi:hypothetical protein
MIVTLGTFIVSNLMGIKRRRIDTGKKIRFCFLQKVLKMYFFAHLHSKVGKIAIMIKKIGKKCGYQKTHNFMR